MPVKIPARPSFPKQRIQLLMARVYQARKGMGFSGRKLVYMLNNMFLGMEDQVDYATFLNWQKGATWPSAESTLALVEFVDWAKRYKAENGFLYQLVPAPKPDAPRIRYDGDHPKLPGERKRKYHWSLDTHVI